MPPIRRLSSTCALLAALGALAPAAPARAQPSLPASWNDVLRPLDAQSRTGVIYDRVLPLSHLERLDGSPASPVVDLATWRQAYDELRRASAMPDAVPSLGGLDAAARAALRRGEIPLALFDRAFERVRPEALRDGSLEVAGGRIAAVRGPALAASRAFAVASLAPRTYRGGDASFVLEPGCAVFDGAAPGALTVDFADGRGPRAVRAGERVRVRYAAAGRKVLVAGLTRADGTTATARFAFDVAALATPSPTDTLHVTAGVPYKGQYGTGDAYVYLAPNHAALVNPVIVVEGFDLDNSMNWDELYALLNQQNLLEDLRADGYDAVVLNFTDATLPVEENGLLVAELVRQVEAQIPPQVSTALVGASMGGLCSRYALAWMETHGVPHRVRTWLSFDGPHGGADIPLGLQYWIRFFSGQSASAASFLQVLGRPAAREMLLYHFTDPAIATGAPDALRDTLLASFAAVGGYPTQPRRVSIANGSGTGQSQGFQPGAQVIRYEYSSLFVSITGDVWAVPGASSKTIFNGNLRILFSGPSQKVTVAGTLPWDGAPGGSRASFYEIDTTQAPYGDIVALYPNHCFIPTVSALGLATSDPFFDVAGTPGLVALTPFDTVYYPVANQEHVLITAENAVWARTEIERGSVVAVPGGGGAPDPVRLTAAPSPFAGRLGVSYAQPRAGAVRLRVYDVTGRLVRTLVDGQRPAGAGEARWDGLGEAGSRAGSGIYYLRLEAAGAVRTRRVVKLG